MSTLFFLLLTTLQTLPMATSLFSNSPALHIFHSTHSPLKFPMSYHPHHSTTSIVGCRGGQNEDTHHSHTFFLPLIGYLTAHAIYDGHSGKNTSEWLEKHALPILQIHLETQVTSSEDTSGFIEAFRQAQLSWQKQIPSSGGSTVTICLFVHLTDMTYNLTIGDGRWYYFHKTTSHILQVTKTRHDFSTNTTTIHTNTPAYNITQQINNPITRLDNKPLSYTTLSSTFNSDDLELFTCVDSNDLYEWKSWCNHHKRIVFPTFVKGCFRILEGPQCLRAIGDKTSLIQHLGVLDIFPILPLHTKAILSCDGIDSHSASTPDTIGHLLHSRDWANHHFFHNHPAVTKLKITNIPSPSTSLLHKIAFLLSSPAFLKLDADWKAGVVAAFQNLKLHPLKITDFLAYYLSARLSDDNISITYFEFQ